MNIKSLLLGVFFISFYFVVKYWRALRIFKQKQIDCYIECTLDNGHIKSVFFSLDQIISRIYLVWNDELWVNTIRIFLYIVTVNCINYNTYTDPCVYIFVHFFALDNRWYLKYYKNDLMSLALVTDRLLSHFYYETDILNVLIWKW